MTNKDLFHGLNHIDEDLIEEARASQNIKDINVKQYKNKNIKRWKKALQSITTVAAVLAVAILGTEVYKLSNTVNQLESSSSTLNSSEITNVGHKSLAEFGRYEIASDYEGLYDVVKAANSDYGKGDLNYGTGIIDTVEDAIMAPEASASMEEATNESLSSSDNAGEMSGEQSSDDSYSTTNVMTEGVDESDIVKTDGNYIYMVESGQISITDISAGEPGDEYLLKPKFEAPSDVIEELFVSDGNLLLVTNHYDDSKEETICYSYDIDDPTSPELIGKSRQDGYYKTSRKIESTVYIFSQEYIETPKYRKKKALLEENLTDWVPKVNDKIISSDCIYIDDETATGTLVASFDVNNPEETIDTKCVMNGYNEIYVSNDAIYFYSRDWNNYRTITDINKMHFDDGMMEAGESTSVSGFLNDSFAINQHNGYLYVLATENDSSVEVNTLHVFDKDMEEVGVINEIARDELIYAARFVGDYAYFITYKQTDPLFVADISDPTNPKLLGELEVSGFSEYLHMWDDTHILGIGYGDGSRDTIKVTMFDVSDPCKPVEEDYINIDDYGYYCEGMYNYKAILADPAKNLIGFAADKYYLLNYDENEGFEIIEEENIKYDNSDGYRGLYSGNDFYVAGNSEIKHIAIGDVD